MVVAVETVVYQMVVMQESCDLVFQEVVVVMMENRDLRVVVLKCCDLCVVCWRAMIFTLWC